MTLFGINISGAVFKHLTKSFVDLNPRDKTIGAILLIVILGAMIFIAKSIPGSVPKVDTKVIASLTTVIGSPNTVIKMNSDNNVVNYNYNEFPKPVLKYDLESASQKGNDGLYHSSYRVKIYYVFGTPMPQIQTSIANCSDVDEKFNNGDWRGPHYEGTETSFHFLVRCVSNSFIQDNDELFWL